MVESRRSASFPAKAFESLRVLREILREKLQSDKATEFRVLGLVNYTHPATAELLDDAVVRDGLTDHLRECYGVRSGMSTYGSMQAQCSFACSALASFRIGMSGVGVFSDPDKSPPCLHRARES